MKFLQRSLLVLSCTFMLSACVLTQSKNTVQQTVAPKISVQLHSVKNAITEDFTGTLTELSKMGIQGVEFAGRFGPYKNDPQGLKTLLDSLSLQASGAHIGLKQLEGIGFERNVSFYKKLGVKLLIVPHDGRVDQPDKVAELAKDISKMSKRLNAVGIKLGYHNHAKEFKAFKDSTFWDYLAQNTPQSMVLQLDVGWSNFAKADSVAYVKRYPNRTLATHIKIRTLTDKSLINKIDESTAVIIGKDNYDWAALVNTLISHGGTQWLVVEQEETHAGKSRLETVAASVKGLKAIMDTL